MPFHNISEEKMDYQPLGNTGLYISRLCLGAMTFGNDVEAMGKLIGNASKDAQKMVDMSIDAGINFFDTANMYCRGVSEEVLGNTLKNKRKDVIIATKVYFPFDGSINSTGLSRLAINREVEGSLKRLGTDYIDLYQVHHFDTTTPLEETLRTLDDLVRSGKVRYIGLSNFAGWQIAKAMGISERLGLNAFCSVQAYYSLVGRELEREVLPAARDLGLGVMVWSPLAGGFLSGKYTRESQAEGRRANFNFPPVDLEQGYNVIDTVKAIAQEHNASAAQVSLAWLLHQPGVSTVIVGARKLGQLEDNLGAVNLKLSDEELNRLNEVSALKPEYPGFMVPMERGVTVEQRWGMD